MALSASMIPVALSAVRSLISLRTRFVEIRAIGQTNDPLPLLLPPLSENLIRDQANDGKRMQKAFSEDAAFRAALEVRGLIEQFDHFNNDIDPQTGEALSAERHSDMFWRFLGLYYQVKDQQEGRDTEEVDIDGRDIDRFLIRSADKGGAKTGLRLLRATAETLVDFMGENAGVFLSRSPNQLMLATLLREFADQTDLEKDRPNRILKRLVASFAVAAADHGANVTDKPAAILLVASLGQVRRDMGDDFAARIVSHDGFTAVMSDWMGRVANDPYLVELLAEAKGLNSGEFDPTDPTTLPAKLQPMFGALQNTLGVIGNNIGTKDALEDEDVFRAVLGAVLTGMADRSGALFREKMDGDRFVAELLEATIKRVGRTGTVRNHDLIAPVFDTLLAQIAQTVPEIGQEKALGRAEVLLVGLADRIADGDFKKTLSDLEARGGSIYARALVTEVFEVAVSSRDLLLDGEPEKTQEIFDVLFAQVPPMLEAGLSREGALHLLAAVARQYYTDDTAKDAFARDILPVVLSLLTQLTEGRVRIDAEDIEITLTAWIQHFELDRPVWQKLHAAGHLELLVSTLASKLTGGSVPKDLSPLILFEIADTAFGVFSRHGVKVSELAEESGDAKAFLKERLGEVIAQAINAAFEKFGVKARSADLPDIVRKVLDKALSADVIEKLKDGDLRDLVKDAIADLDF